MIPTTNAKQIFLKKSSKQKKLHSISSVEESSGKFKSVDAIVIKLNIYTCKTNNQLWMDVHVLTEICT